MVEVIGDIVMASELIIPKTVTLPAVSGAIICSGAILFFNTGAGVSQITST